MDSWVKFVEGFLTKDLWILESRTVMAIAAFEAEVVPAFHHKSRVHREVAAFAVADDGEWEKTMFDDLGDVFLRKLLGRNLFHGCEVAVFFPADKASIGATEDDVSHRSFANEGHRHVLDASIDAEDGFDVSDLQRGEAGALENLEPELAISHWVARSMRKKGLVREVSESRKLNVFVSAR